MVPIPKKEISLYKTATFVSVLIIIGLLSYRMIDRQTEKKIASIEKSIAVLPLPDEELFRKESSRKYNFIGHQITTCLLKVKGYRVVPWDESRRYLRKPEASYNEMGEDLKAAILVDWEPYETSDEKYLSVNLISAIDSDLLWSKNYKIDGSWPTEICKHSGEISKKITRELRIYLTPRERAFISKEPASPSATMWASLGSAMASDAWERALTGTMTTDSMKNEYTNRASFEKAVSDFTHAIEEDPGYAYAYAGRARAKLWGIRAAFFDKSVLDECESDITKALELEPDLPEAHIALGFYYYYGKNELLMALGSFEEAAALKPGNTEYLFYLSIVKRALRSWDQVKTLTDKVFEANPRNALLMTNLGMSYLALHEFHIAIECHERSIDILPSWDALYINKIDVLLSMGNVGKARSVIAEATEKTGKDLFRTKAWLGLYEGNYTDAVNYIEKSNLPEFWNLGETEGDMYLLKGKVYGQAGRKKPAKENYDSAVEYFRNIIMFNPDDYLSRGKLGIALAGLGTVQEAIEHGQTAMELSTSEEVPSVDPITLYHMIQIYAQTGDIKSAMQHSDELVKMNSPFTTEYLRLDPDLKHLFP